jgi:hypothetical protein
MKTYCGVEVELHAFLTPALNGGEWSASRPSRFTPRERATGPRPMRCETDRNKIHFYGEVLLAPHPTPNLEDRPLSAVRDCLFNIFAATFRIWRPVKIYLVTKYFKAPQTWTDSVA